MAVAGGAGGRVKKPGFSKKPGFWNNKRNDLRGKSGALRDFLTPMLTLINTNRMLPPIAPIGLDYVAGAVRRAGCPVELVDLNLSPDADAALADHFRRCQPDLVGLTFRNVDDCFWPSGESFVPVLQRDIAAVRRHTDGPGRARRRRLFDLPAIAAGRHGRRFRHLRRRRRRDRVLAAGDSAATAAGIACRG